jgi:hypothetical protein
MRSEKQAIVILNIAREARIDAALKKRSRVMSGKVAANHPASTLSRLSYTSCLVGVFLRFVHMVAK